MAVLLARHLRYDWDQPDQPDNDHFILSNGHASPLLYAAFKAVRHQPRACREHRTVGSHRAW
jgi:transketolase